MAGYYKGDIQPAADGSVIMVFGSNPEGRHGAGAAKVARERFGAQYGVGEGLTGQAYALPTKDLRVTENRGLRSISRDDIVGSIMKLYEAARANPDKMFCIAYRNTDKASLSGYTGYEMMSMFNDAGPMPANVYVSEEWMKSGRIDGVEGRELRFWGRRADNSYELSTRGDKRFSAFSARLSDGRTIEDAYQLDVKGYRKLGYTALQAKNDRGVHAPNNLTEQQLWDQYLSLWRQFAAENPDLVEDLRVKSSGKVLTDQFANGNVSQARAWALILTEQDEAVRLETELRRRGYPPELGFGSLEEFADELQALDKYFVTENIFSVIRERYREFIPEQIYQTNERWLRDVAVFEEDLIRFSMEELPVARAVEYYLTLSDDQKGRLQNLLNERLAEPTAAHGYMVLLDSLSADSLLIDSDILADDIARYSDDILKWSRRFSDDAGIFSLDWVESTRQARIQAGMTDFSDVPDYAVADILKRYMALSPEEKRSLRLGVDVSAALDALREQSEASSAILNIIRGPYRDDEERVAALEPLRRSYPLLRDNENLFMAVSFISAWMGMSKQTDGFLSALAEKYNPVPIALLPLRDKIIGNREAIQAVHDRYFPHCFSFEVLDAAGGKVSADSFADPQDYAVADILREYGQLPLESKKALNLPELTELSLDALWDQSQLSTGIVGILNSAGNDSQAAVQALRNLRDGKNLSDGYLLQAVEFLSANLGFGGGLADRVISELKNEQVMNSVNFKSPEQALVYAKAMYLPADTEEERFIQERTFGEILLKDDKDRLSAIYKNMSAVSSDWKDMIDHVIGQICQACGDDSAKGALEAFASGLEAGEKTGREPRLMVSYYGSRDIPKDAMIVQISTSAPKGMKMDAKLPSVYPDYKTMVGPYKEGAIDDKGYTDRYAASVLGKNRQAIFADVSGLIEQGRAQGRDIVLCCYEKPGDFCHRYLLSNFLNENGIACMELPADRKKYSVGKVPLFGEDASRCETKKSEENGSGIIFTESKGGYQQRTRENAQHPDVDFTIAFAVDFSTYGEKCTAKAAGDSLIAVDIEQKDGWLQTAPSDAFKAADEVFSILPEEFQNGEPMGLNIAGNGIYTLFANDSEQESSVLQGRIDEFVTGVLVGLRNKGVVISTIRSGGQTGVDEAGAYAGVCLGVPTSVHAPKGFLMRDASGKDLFGKQAFVARFNDKDYTSGRKLVKAILSGEFDKSKQVSKKPLKTQKKP